MNIKQVFKDSFDTSWIAENSWAAFRRTTVARLKIFAFFISAYIALAIILIAVETVSHG